MGEKGNTNSPNINQRKPAKFIQHCKIQKLLAKKSIDNKQNEFLLLFCLIKFKPLLRSGSVLIGGRLEAHQSQWPKMNKSYPCPSPIDMKHNIIVLESPIHSKQQFPLQPPHVPQQTFRMYYRSIGCQFFLKIRTCTKKLPSTHTAGNKIKFL